MKENAGNHMLYGLNAEKNRLTAVESNPYHPDKDQRLIDPVNGTDFQE